MPATDADAAVIEARAALSTRRPPLASPLEDAAWRACWDEEGLVTRKSAWLYTKAGELWMTERAAICAGVADAEAKAAAAAARVAGAAATGAMTGAAGVARTGRGMGGVSSTRLELGGIGAAGRRADSARGVRQAGAAPAAAPAPAPTPAVAPAPAAAPTPEPTAAPAPTPTAAAAAATKPKGKGKKNRKSSGRKVANAARRREGATEAKSGAAPAPDTPVSGGWS